MEGRRGVGYRRLERSPYGRDSTVVDEALVVEELVDRGRRTAVWPVGEPGTDEQPVDRSGIAGFEMAGGVPTAFAPLRPHDDAQQAAEVAGRGEANAGRGTAGAQCPLADAGVLAPYGECSGIGGAGDVVDYKPRPARVRIHARFPARGASGTSSSS